MALVANNLPANAGDLRDLGSIPGSGRSPGGGHGNPLQYSCLENPMDREPGGLQSVESQRVGHDWSADTRIITTRVWGDWAGGMHLSDAGKETEYFEGERAQIPRAVPARALETIRTWISLKHSAARDAQELTDLQSCLTSLEDGRSSKTGNERNIALLPSSLLLRFKLLSSHSKTFYPLIQPL